jgi:succinate dehydrogenase / fumarate reductase flavoprotein subunit
MARNRAGLEGMLRAIPTLRERFWREVSVPATAGGMNQALEYAGRVADFIDFAEVLATDALTREESCGAHFREEYQTEDGEAKRNDADYSFVSAWGYNGENQAPVLTREALQYEFVKPSVRSYK